MNNPKTPNDPPAKKEKREREQKEIWEQQERERVTPQDEPTEIMPIPDIPKPGVDPRSWPERDSKT
jgi:hypothetical protein